MFNASRKLTSLRWGIAVLAITASGWMLPTAANAQLSGAIYTTNLACNGTDLNIYVSKDAVYLNGGPRHLGAAGLPDGEYYVQVTVPDGALLGTSLGMADETPVTVVNGAFTGCPQLSAILKKASNGSPGYDTTTNGGGEYKVWVSQVSDFTNSSTKTDNFKVNSDEGGGGGVESVGTLVVQKYYDANANGIQDGTEPLLIDWKVAISGCINQDVFTTYSAGVDPGVCVAQEYMPTQTNWIRTTPAGTDTISVTVPDGGTGTALFGNVCVGAGGGLTLGYWSNKNGQARITGQLDSLAALTTLNLVNADGTAFNPATYAQFRTWILNATATNMAYMLSAQLAAMRLNVYFGLVSSSALIYAPGTNSANALGFATVGAVMAEANTELGLHPTALSGDTYRSYQEALKNALDKANNNLNFVQGSACPFSF
jgi:hypothetical protein